MYDEGKATSETYDPVQAEKNEKNYQERLRRNKDIRYNKKVAEVAETKQKQKDAETLEKTNKAELEKKRTTAKQTEQLEKEKEERDRAEFVGDEGAQSQKSKRLGKRTAKISEKRKRAETKKGLIGKIRARRLANKEDRISDKRDESEAFDKLTPAEKKAYKRGTLKDKEKQTGQASGRRSKADRRLAIQNAANMLAS